MVLVVLYAGAGVYLALLAFGLIHKGWWAKIDPYTRSNVRLAVSILAVGSIGLAIYTAHLYDQFRERPPASDQAESPNDSLMISPESVEPPRENPEQVE